MVPGEVADRGLAEHGAEVELVVPGLELGPEALEVGGDAGAERLVEDIEEAHVAREVWPGNEQVDCRLL